jgi:CBS domain-containing protein
MLTLTKPLLALTANDLMTRTVTLIPREMSLQGAARMLRNADVSGAPVVDTEGRCIGIISAGDFLVRATGGDWPDRRLYGNPGCAHSAWQMLDIESIHDGEVARFMTVDPVTVPPNTPIGDLARFMVDAHIHRLVVVDDENRPQGIVSSTDILAAVARAAARPKPAPERKSAEFTINKPR